MPHGQRDWSNIGAEKTVHGLMDVGELAARLGSPVTFNREGYVLLMDTFEYGHSRWSLNGIDPYEAEISAEWSRYGAYSLKFSVAADAGKYALMDSTFPYPVAGKYGVEFSTRVDTHISLIHVDLRFYDGVVRQKYLFYLHPINEQLYIWDRDEAYTVIVDPLPISAEGQLWHTIKVVVDMESQYFQRIIVDNAEYDLSDYRPTLFSTTVAPYASIRLQFYGHGSGAGTAYVDDVILTQNEP